MISERRWLLVEDDDVDAMTVRRALKELGEEVKIERVVDGQQALARLRWSEGPGFGLVLLDLNMPRMTGIELLRALKAEPELRRPPVVVWSTAAEGDERGESLLLGAAGCFVKDADHGTMVATLEEILRIEKKGGRT